MDLLPDYGKTSQLYQDDVQRQNQTNQANHSPLLDLNDDAVFTQWKAKQIQQHTKNFPLGPNLFALVFIVVSDLSEAQRERLQSTLSLRGIRIEDYDFSIVKDVFLELFCAPKSSLDNPSLRVSGQGTHQRSFCVLEDGTLEGTSGYWVQDDETGQEGFVGEFEDTFWTYDDTEWVWQTSPVKKRFLRRGPPKGNSKGKGRKGKYRFRPRGKGYVVQETHEQAAPDTHTIKKANNLAHPSKEGREKM